MSENITPMENWNIDTEDKSSTMFVYRKSKFGDLSEIAAVTTKTLFLIDKYPYLDIEISTRRNEENTHRIFVIKIFIHADTSLERVQEFREQYNNFFS